MVILGLPTYSADMLDSNIIGMDSIRAPSMLSCFFSRILLILFTTVALASTVRANQIIGLTDCNCTNLTVQLSEFPQGSLVAHFDDVVLDFTYDYTNQTITISRPVGLAPGTYWLAIWQGNEFLAAAFVTLCDCNPSPCAGTILGLTITESYPSNPVSTGDSVVFGGSVSNSGNITLTNVLVFSSQPGNTLVLGPITLAPGAASNFTGSYLAIGGSNPATNSTIVTNSSGTITTNVVSTLTTNNTVTVTTNVVSTLTTNNAVTVTTNVVSTVATNNSDTVTTNVVSTVVTNNTVTIMTNAVAPSFVSIRSPLADRPGEVVDRFEVGTNLNGLTFYGSASLYGPTLLYSIRHDDLSPSIFTTIKTEVAPHTDPPRTEPKDSIGLRNYDSLAFAAPQITGASSVSFYYLRHDSVGASYFGYIIPGGVYADMFTGGSIGTNFDALTFAAPNAAAQGANLFYYLRHDLSGNSFFGTINPDAATSGVAANDLFNLGKKIDYMTFSAVDTGYGPENQFYYLRHDADGNTVFGTINASVTFVGTPSERAVDRFTLTGRFQELEFTATDVGYNANLFYSIRGGTSLATNILTTFSTNSVITLTTNTLTTFSTNSIITLTTNIVSTPTTNSVTTWVTNSVITLTTNALITLTTNTVVTYTTNSVVSFTPTNTVTAVGQDICQARTVAAAANGLGPVNPQLPVPIAGAPAMTTNGFFGFSFPTENGIPYTVQYKNALNDPDWTDLETVIGTGANQSITDPAAAQLPERFYRITFTP